MSEKARLYQKVMLVTISSLLTLALLEVLVRRLPGADALLFRPSPVPGLAYSLVPDQDARYGLRRCRINRWGFRGAEFPMEKAPGTLRVAAVGDSVTFGEGDEDGGYPAKLERLLAASGRPVEVINAGVPSYSTCQDLVTARDVLPPFKPDLVVVGYAVNDPEGPRVPFGLDLATGRIAPWWRVYHFFKQRLVTVRWTWAQAAPLITRLRGHQYYGPPADPKDQIRYVQALHDPKGAYWPAAAECIKGLGKFQRDTGTPVILAVFPLFNHWDSSELSGIYKQVSETARKEGLQTINLREELVLDRKSIEDIKGDGMHPSPEGYQLAAEVIHRKLQSLLLQRLK